MAFESGAEARRLEEAKSDVRWRKWGPYLSERQWGTVREDYSEGGDAWSYFRHDQARSRAYRWGEDGLAGFSDDQQRLCFGLALWNGKDPILKERLFGLTNAEGNHGEDVKEFYFYLDSTPTHSYNKWLYKYPQREYPYLDLVETNRRRSRYEFEYELIDTKIFAPRDVSAPEQPAAGVRVELRRREPARAAVGDDLPLPYGGDAARDAGPAVLEARVRQAPRELHVVGEPQGPLRQERLRGRLPRDGQHRRLRSICAAAHGREPRTGGWHGMGLALLSEHARDRDGDRGRRSDLRRPRGRVRRSLPPHRERDESRRPGRHVGRSRPTTASTPTRSASGPTSTG